MNLNVRIECWKVLLIIKDRERNGRTKKIMKHNKNLLDRIRLRTTARSSICWCNVCHYIYLP
jgi:hypothetical protein